VWNLTGSVFQCLYDVHLSLRKNLQQSIS
jgi:hypothetical protein